MLLLYQPFLEVSVGRVSKKIFLTLPEHVAPLSKVPASQFLFLLFPAPPHGPFFVSRCSTPPRLYTLQ